MASGKRNRQLKKILRLLQTSKWLRSRTPLITWKPS
ncbi:MAG: hypothetical protein K2X77_20845 [Candidatus Obscuribacterales bacterium]|nr:hypothetical protein [Candidatus Obscuribacterales bacterium]